MIILINGASHTGKTKLAQELLEKYHYPYLSIDHLKMGLIRSKQTNLTPLDDDLLIDYLWPIVKEIIKTAIENNQNLIIEGCYIPHNYKDYFENNYLDNIKYYCIIMTKDYILKNVDKIKEYRNVIEDRLIDEIDVSSLIKDNEYNLEQSIKYNNEYILINNEYINLSDIDIKIR